MRWLYAATAFLSLVCVVCLFSGSFARSASAMEAAAVSDPTVDLSAEVTDPASGAESGSDPTDPAADSGAAALAAGDTESVFDALAYLDVSCSLGELRLYLPYGVELDAVTVVDGQIMNLSGNTVYLYSPEYPDYTFYASRFSMVQYRTTNTGSYTELTGVSLTSSGAAEGSSYDFVLIFLLALIAFILVRKGLFTND